jgi:phosphate transport system protein
MTFRLHKELEKIKKRLLLLSESVEEKVRFAAEALQTSNLDLANKIIKTDYEIDEIEVEIEEDCLKILALYQPVAADLRLLIAVIKINNELERIGDQAVNIAQRIKAILKNERCDYSFDYTEMFEKTQFMLKQSLYSLVESDIDIALKVRILDDEVDSMKVEAYKNIKKAMIKYPICIDYLLNLFLISRHIERIGDHATNIAEEVVYMIQGEIIRHED